jgi:hypothetical protein
VFAPTTRAVPGAVCDLIRTFTAGRFFRFFTQSAEAPPPLSRYRVPSRIPNQISISCGRPVFRPVVVR